MYDVMCLGIFVVDVIARTVDRYPGRGELQLCNEMRPFIGGCAANTGIGLQKLGISTTVAGKVGQDGFGDFVKTTLASHGVDFSGLVTDPDTGTSATMAMVASDGERSFIHYPGANGVLNEDDVDWDLVQQARLLHVAGHFLMPTFDGEQCGRVLKKARELGLKTSLDTAWDDTGRWMQLLRPSLQHLDYFVPSYEEARRCTGGDTPQEVARALQDEGVGVVALKLGEQGSYIRSGDQEWHIPPYKVAAVDATGAGDAFAAGFLAGIVRGLDLESAGRLGNAAGACCVTALGTVGGLRSYEETVALMQGS